MKYSPIPKTKYLGFLQSHSRTMYQNGRRILPKHCPQILPWICWDPKHLLYRYPFSALEHCKFWLTTGETLQEQDKKEISNVISRGLQSQREPVIVH